MEDLDLTGASFTPRMSGLPAHEQLLVPGCMQPWVQGIRGSLAICSGCISVSVSLGRGGGGIGSYRRFMRSQKT